ncbi:helix-turn-helix domain-containing protein [Streptomyces carminius]|uniref:helix-turn-helix domain-containing protein n=1 Tax=Streptomyces carminius TaxID=2665496 RepID=UPI001E496236|nr:helix-turn-helix domain-containing protein [Streptomyces carminius]
MAQQQPATGPNAFAVLELLASEAPADRFESLVSQARGAGVSEADVTQLENARRLALRVQSQLDRRQQREADLSALVDTARELAAPYDLDTVLRIAIRRARLLLGTDLACAGLPEGDRETLRIRACDGNVSALPLELRLPRGPGADRDALTGPAPAWTPDYLADTRFRDGDAFGEMVRAEGLRAVLAVPLSHGRAPFGTLYVADRDVRHFTTDEISLLTSLGDLVGAAVERALLLERTAAEVAALERYAARTEAGLRELREIGEVQDQLLDRVLRGGSLPALAEEASRSLAGPLRVHAADGTFLAGAGDLPEPDGTALTAATLDACAAREPVELDDGLQVAPVFAGDEYLGRVLFRPATPVTGHARRLLGLVTQTVAVLLTLHNGRSATLADQGRDELLGDLLAAAGRPVPHLEKRARRLGLDLHRPHVVAVVHPENGVRDKEPVWAVSYAHRRSGLGNTHEGHLVLLLPGEDAGAVAREVFDELSPLLRKAVTVGAAGPVSSPESVHRAFLEARRCLAAMAALGITGQSASARELGFLGLLLSEKHDVEGFIESAVGPVLDYDRQRLTELARTLEVYFEAGSSPTHAAKRLHVHPNTVARRLERIGELLGADWQQADRSLEIQVALRLSRLRHVLRVPGPPPAVRE